MRWSKLFCPTLKEDPAHAESNSHRLLIRGGFIRPLGAGIYSLLPLAHKIRHRLIALIAAEMAAIDAQEFLLPALHPQEIWEASGRLTTMGEIMFRLKDRKGAPYVLGVTHEEIFTGIAKAELKSYRQLPQRWYQFQTKFRDEARPKGGLLRVREFTMKDSYSFDIDQTGLDVAFESHRQAYQNIFGKHLGLPYCMVEASSGAMGGSQSGEFMINCNSGEDTLVTCKACGYAANSEKAESIANTAGDTGQSQPIEKFATPQVRTIVQLEQFSGGAKATKQIKTLVYVLDGLIKLILLRGDTDLNESKLIEFTGASQVRPAQDEEIFAALGAHAGSLGAVGVSSTSHPLVTEILADSTLIDAVDMVTGANQDDYHYRHVDIGRDIKVDQFASLKSVKDNDSCSKCKAPLSLSKGLEIGHIFKLGVKYSESMGAYVLDQAGNQKPLYMGSYGIGVERLMAACVEVFGDEKGMVWPLSIAPYAVVITPVGQEPEVQNYALELYKQLQNRAIDVLLDDRDLSPGVKFAESELIGIPYRITVGKKLKQGEVELLTRLSRQVQVIKVEEIVETISQLLFTVNS